MGERLLVVGGRGTQGCRRCQAAREILVEEARGGRQGGELRREGEVEGGAAARTMRCAVPGLAPWSPLARHALRATTGGRPRPLWTAAARRRFARARRAQAARIGRCACTPVSNAVSSHRSPQPPRSRRRVEAVDGGAGEDTRAPGADSGADREVRAPRTHGSAKRRPPGSSLARLAAWREKVFARRGGW